VQHQLLRALAWRIAGHLLVGIREAAERFVATVERYIGRAAAVLQFRHGQVDAQHALVRLEAEAMVFLEPAPHQFRADAQFAQFAILDAPLWLFPHQRDSAGDLRRHVGRIFGRAADLARTEAQRQRFLDVGEEVDIFHLRLARAAGRQAENAGGLDRCIKCADMLGRACDEGVVAALNCGGIGDFHCRSGL